MKGLWANLTLKTVGKPCMIYKKNDINRDRYFKNISLAKEQGMDQKGVIRDGGREKATVIIN